MMIGLNILGVYYLKYMFLKRLSNLTSMLFPILVVCFFSTFSMNRAYAYISSAPLEEMLSKSDPKIALAEIEKQKRDLSQADYLLLKSNALLLLRNWKDALDILEPMYNSDPSNAVIANNYSAALWGIGKKDQAKSVLEKNLLMSSPSFRNLRKLYLSNAADAYSLALDGKTNSKKIDLSATTKSGTDIEIKPVPPVVVASTDVDKKSKSDADKSDKSTKADIADKLDKANKADKADKADKSDKVDKADKRKDDLAKSEANKETKESKTGSDKVVTDASTNAKEKSSSKDKTPPSKEPTPPEYATIENNVRGWASAWSSKNIKSYLSFYSTSFKPDGGMSYSEWVTQRTQRVTKPGPIDVKATILSYSGSDKKVIVKIMQKYTSTNLKTDLNKYLEFTNDQGKWLITREYNR